MSVETPIQRQSYLFQEALFKQVQAMQESSGESGDALAAQAEEYLTQGLTTAECVELLMIDGFSSDRARCYLEARAEVAESSSEVPVWDFTCCDAYGRLWTGSRFGMTVRANTRADALRRALLLVKTEDDSPEYIVDAWKIG